MALLITQESLRAKFEYLPESGRLRRVGRGRGARVGVLVGAVGDLGHRRAYLSGRNRMTAHLVWLWHHGELPDGILKHANGDNGDDRIENLAPVKQPLRIIRRVEGDLRNEYGRLTEEVSGIYEITCIENGRRYIGSAVSVDKRWRQHFTQLQTGKHHSKHLQRAWNKYGEAAFAFRVVEECQRESLIEREQHYIDTTAPAFNSRPVAGSQLGWKPSEDTRQKMRAARAGKSSWMKGRRHSEETKAKVSASRKGKGGGPRSEERKQKAAAAMRASKGAITEETAREIKRMKALGFSHGDVAKAVGRSYWAVADIARGKTYAWVN